MEASTFGDTRRKASYCWSLPSVSSQFSRRKGLEWLCFSVWVHPGFSLNFFGHDSQALISCPRKPVNLFLLAVQF